jgi:hypothetical protein
MSATSEKSVRQTSRARRAPTPAEGSVERDRDRVNVAFVENAEHDVDDDNGRENKKRLARE